MTRERQDRAGKVLITQINRKDCIDDDQLGFELALEQYAGYSLEIWAGTACDQATNRLSAVAATCWQVYTTTPSSIVASAHFGVRALLAGRTGGDNAGDAPSSNIPECTPTSEAVGAQPLTAYAMLIDANQSVAALATWKATYKLRAEACSFARGLKPGRGSALWVLVLGAALSRRLLDRRRRHATV